MLQQWIRLLNYNGTTLTDVSLDNQDGGTDLAMALTTSSYFYIGKHFPFNNFFIHIGTANTNASVLSIEYWNGREWKAAVDILDATSSAGKTLAKSGVIQFSPNSDYSWQSTDDTSDTGGTPTELRTKTIYHCYWLRLKVSADLSITTAIKTLSYAFTTTTLVDGLDVTIKDYKTAFASGKTDWINEIMTASLLVVKDLQRRMLIIDEGSVLRFDDVCLATEFKTISFIMGQLGPSFKERAEKYEQDYKDAISTSRFKFDTNENALLDGQEVKGRTTTLVR